MFIIIFVHKDKCLLDHDVFFFCFYDQMVQKETFLKQCNHVKDITAYIL